jgi:hypothetical protein
MNDNDFLDFSNAMATLGTVYGKEKPAEVIDLYFNALEPYDFATVKESIKRHVEGDETESKFYPVPATLKIICKNMWAEKNESKKKIEQFRQQKLTAEEPELSKIELATNLFCLSLAMTRKPKYDLDIVEKLGGWTLIKQKYEEIKDGLEMRDWLREQCKIREIV